MTEAPPRPKARAPRGFLDRRAGAAGGRAAHPGGGRRASTKATASRRWRPARSSTPTRSASSCPTPTARTRASSRCRTTTASGWRCATTSPRRWPGSSRRTGSSLPKPFRRYAFGKVWRDEKPGPGRYREFVQCDADTVGSARPEADAEIIAMAVEGYAAAGLPRAAYQLKINNRKLLNGLLDRRRRRARRPEAGGAARGRQARPAGTGRRQAAAGRRAAGRVGRLHAGRRAWPAPRSTRCWRSSAAGAGRAGGDARPARQRDRRLGRGRRGAGRSCRGSARRWPRSASARTRRCSTRRWCAGWSTTPAPSSRPSCWAESADESGEPVRFGSIGGGGRYDDLVARFTGERTPATGFSFGVSRLAAALAASGRADEAETRGPVVVIAFDQARMGDYFALAAELRAAGIAAEVYLGDVRHARADALRRPAALARRGDPRRGRDRRRPGDGEGPRPRPRAGGRHQEPRRLSRGAARPGDRAARPISWRPCAPSSSGRDEDRAARPGGRAGRRPRAVRRARRRRRSTRRWSSR